MSNSLPTFDPEAARAAWLRNGLGELGFWLVHLDEKTARLIAEEKEGRYRYIEQAELIFVYSAFINRLAQVSLKTHRHIPLKDFVPWLAQVAGWPEYVARAFWYCVRNPVVHVGRAWAMADYGQKLDGVVLKAGFQPSMVTQVPSSSAQPSGTGWFEVRWPEPEASIAITFDFRGVRQVAANILQHVRDQVSAMNESDLRKLARINERIPFFYVTSPSDSDEVSQ